MAERSGKGKQGETGADVKKRHFNLVMEPEMALGLNRAAARIQLETGKRVTVTGLITRILNDFLSAQDGGTGQGGEN